MRIQFKANPSVAGVAIGEVTIDNKQHVIIKLDVGQYIDEGVMVSIVLVQPNLIQQESTP